jgi:nucleoside-diphosphate-sugar epimerase
MTAIPLAGRRVLLTGATGFIGGHVLRRLAAAGADVHAVCLTPPVARAEATQWWAADLAEAAAADQLVATVHPDVLVHLASAVTGARDLAAVRSTFASNLAATVNLLVACAEAGCPRAVLAGSLEETLVDPAGAPPSPYAAAKSAAGTYARLFHALFGLSVVTLRVGMTYGPGQRDLDKLVPYVIRSLARGEAPRLSSGGRAVDWIYVEDVADAFVAAAATDAGSGMALDVGTGEARSLREIVERLVALMGSPVTPVFGALPDRAMDGDWRADPEPTARILGWRASTSLDGGLGRSIDWYAAALGDEDEGHDVRGSEALVD